MLSYLDQMSGTLGSCGPRHFLSIGFCIFSRIGEAKRPVALFEPRIEAFTSTFEELLKTDVR